MRITVKLYASLSDYLPADARKEHSVNVEFPDSMSLAQVVESMRLPAEHVHLVLLNGVYIEPGDRASTTVADGDAVAVWPPIAGG